MKTKSLGLARSMIWGLLAASACAGTRLNDVGDVAGDGGTAAGEASSVAGEASSVAGVGGSSTAGTTHKAGSTSKAGNGAGGVASRGGSENEGGVGATGNTGPQGGEFNIATELECGVCEELAAAGEVTGLDATDSAVFWIEHGTYDELLNYNQDGRLLSIPRSGGTPVLLADDLEGPSRVKVSLSYAYVFVDESSSAGQGGAGSGLTELVRVPRSGGATEKIQSVSLVDLTVGPDFAAWVDDRTVYKLADEPNAEPVVLAEADAVFNAFSDESLIYLLTDKGISTVPVAGGALTPLRKFENPWNSYRDATISGDSIYAIEEPEASTGAYYLVTMPKTGASWKRVMSMPRFTQRMALAGDLFVATAPHRVGAPGSVAQRMFQGEVTTPHSVAMLLEAPKDRELAWQTEVWDVTKDGLFLADAGRILNAPIIIQ